LILILPCSNCVGFERGQLQWVGLVGGPGSCLIRLVPLTLHPTRMYSASCDQVPCRGKEKLQPTRLQGKDQLFTKAQMLALSKRFNSVSVQFDSVGLPFFLRSAGSGSSSAYFPGIAKFWNPTGESAAKCRYISDNLHYTFYMFDCQAHKTF
jgi:hypothetical protein